LDGNARRPKFYAADTNQPIGEWKKAWKIACHNARLRYRRHDCRHTFVTRLAENPTVGEETIRALAGRVSTKMLERYSHIRHAAKQAAIATLEAAAVRTSESDMHLEEQSSQASQKPVRPN
jgi:integrase